MGVVVVVVVEELAVESSQLDLDGLRDWHLCL